MIVQATPLEIIRDFRRRAPECSSNTEAKYYLEESNYIMVEALEKFHEDAKWEKQNATKFKPGVMVPSKKPSEEKKGFSVRGAFASLWYMCQLGAE